MSAIEHGTRRGYAQCVKRAEGACPACRRAQSDYMQEWRQRYPTAQKREQHKQDARGRALRALARAHPAEFRRLYDAELAKLPDLLPHATAARRAR